MVLGGSGFTVPSNSVLHYVLNISLYPLILSLLSLDILFNEEIRNPGSTWKGKLGLLQTLRAIYILIILFPAVITMITFATIATVVMFFEKLFWSCLEICTLRLLSFTSISRGTQELMEFVSKLVPYIPKKETHLRLTISDGDISASGYREPYIERGDWTRFFLIQFEFPDPRLRDEALSILHFNSTCCLMPIIYYVSERRVLVLSPFGWIESVNVVKALKLYTDEHSTQTVKTCMITSRWHDTRNNAIRCLTLSIERKGTPSPADKAFICWMPGHHCISVLELKIRDSMLKLLPEVFTDLNILPDLSRSRMGLVHISGLMLWKIILATAITAGSIAYYELDTFKKESGVDGYAVLLAIWAFLYSWGFEPFLGPTVITVDSVVSNMKMTVLYSIAHDTGNMLFRDGTCSWTNRTMRGTHEPPQVSKEELFLATHTLVMGNDLYQMAMSDGLASIGKVVQSGRSVQLQDWKGIFRTGNYSGIFNNRRQLML